MVCLIHDAGRCYQIPDGGYDRVIYDLAKRHRYSLDSDQPRNAGMAAELLEQVNALRHPHHTRGPLLISTKPETNGCLQAMEYRPVITGITADGNLLIERNSDPAYEMKTLVFAAKVGDSSKWLPSSKLSSDESIILLAFHCRADKNIMNPKKIEIEVNRLLANSLGRRGKSISLMDETEFMLHFNDSLTGKLGLEKGEINPFSIIQAASNAGLPLISFVDSSISHSTQPIATNWCRRTLSIRFPSGEDLYGCLTAMATKQDLVARNMIDGVALPIVLEAPHIKFFQAPQSRRDVDDGWNWNPASLIQTGQGLH